MKVEFYGHVRQYHNIKSEIDRNIQTVLESGQYVMGPMLKRFEKAWGRRDANAERWASHGAAKYLTKDAAPMFLNTSDTESPEPSAFR